MTLKSIFLTIALTSAAAFANTAETKKTEAAAPAVKPEITAPAAETKVATEVKQAKRKRVKKAN